MPSKLFPNLSYSNSKKQTKPKKFQTKNELIRNYLIIFGVVTVIVTVILGYFKIPLSPILVVVTAANLGAFLLMGLDKTYSQSENVTRIPELFFYMISLIGGSIGVILGSQVFRHKTLKISFLMWPIMILVIQVMIVMYVVFKG